MTFDEWFADWVKAAPEWNDAAGNYETIAAEAWEYQERKLAELQAQKTRSQEHYIKLLRDKDAARKAQCIAFAQWFRQGNNRRDRDADACYELWLEAQVAEQVELADNALFVAKALREAAQAFLDANTTLEFWAMKDKFKALLEVKK